MKIACTGYVSSEAGSVAAANAELLRALLDAGCNVDFFSKSSFVDPRPAAAGRPGFRFVETDNRRADGLRRATRHVPGLGFLAGQLDVATYHRLLIATMRREHRQRNYDVVLWLGEYARGRIAGVPSVSFAQGPPGTDARSFLRRADEIRALAGALTAAKWSAAARWRLSPAGRTPFHHSDRIIIGSAWSAACLAQRYGIAPARISTLPYPIDLAAFAALPGSTEPNELRVLWLGRIVPRKRLDLFLDGAARAIDGGCPLRLTVVGSAPLIPAYENLLRAFRHPARLDWRPSCPRAEVPALLHAHDLLAQPSEEENFGSSVAEALACGRPAIVGRTNGTGDYLCPLSIRLSDDRPETFAAALIDCWQAKQRGEFPRPAVSRAAAERHFDARDIAARLRQILPGTPP